MAHLLITSGPTRQYLDPVRFLTNASSGRMGAAVAAAALAAGHQVTIVSGPVEIDYPCGAEVRPVVTTAQMLSTCLECFPDCDGVIGVAAPCDYQPRETSPRKLRKTGHGLRLDLVETPDIMAALGAIKENRWMVAFALETDDARIRAMQKLERKNCDLIVLNGPGSIHSLQTEIEVLNGEGTVLLRRAGTKAEVATALVDLIQKTLIARPDSK